MRPPAPAVPANNPPQKVTIAPGGEVPDQRGETISAGLAHTDEMHHRQTTAQLMQTTEDNLRSVNRQLNAEEQNLVDQIRNFMAQAHAAITDNDLVRAHNLALKAHLLSDELVRR